MLRRAGARLIKGKEGGARCPSIVLRDGGVGDRGRGWRMWRI